MKTDLLILGAGAAGMRSAIAAAEAGVRVTLATKGPAARSGATPMACRLTRQPSQWKTIATTRKSAFEDTCFEGRYLGMKPGLCPHP